MKSTWIMVGAAVFLALITISVPAGTWACQKALQTAGLQSDDKGFSDSRFHSEYGSAEMSPSAPAEKEWGHEEWSESYDEGRDEMTPSSPKYGEEEGLTPSDSGSDFQEPFLSENSPYEAPSDHQRY